MKVVGLLLFMCSVLLAQSQYVQNIAKLRQPITFGDSTRFNLSELAGFKSTYTSYGAVSQGGVCGGFFSNAYETDVNYSGTPAVYGIYNNEKGDFYFGAYEYVEERVTRDEWVELDASANRALFYMNQGTDLTKISFGVEAEFGTIAKEDKNKIVEKDIYSLDAVIGSLIKIGWNSEFVLEFDFNFLKDSLRLNDKDYVDETRYSNYVPDINLGFVSHSELHRELLYASWNSNKRNVPALNQSDVWLFENYEASKFGLWGSVLIASTPFDFSYQIEYSYEYRGLWKTTSMKKNLADVYIKQVPFSFAFNYKRDIANYTLDLSFNPMTMEVYDKKTDTSYLTDLRDVDDSEFEIGVSMQYPNVVYKDGGYNLGLFARIGGGYVNTHNRDINSMRYIDWNDIGSDVFVQEDISLDASFATYTRARARLSAGLNSTFVNSVGMDIFYELSVYRDGRDYYDTISEELFTGNNLLLKVYYLF